MQTTLEEWVPTTLHARLVENGRRHRAGKMQDGGIVPLVRLYDVYGNGEWLIAALDPENPDLAYGYCSSGRSGGLLSGAMRLSTLASADSSDGQTIVRDRYFKPGPLDPLR